MLSLQIQVKGKVQGVYFRKSTQVQAQALGIQGFVRNEPDGSVYIEAEGHQESLDQFLAWCWKGPEHAQVKEVKSAEQSSKHYEGFEVRY